MKLAVILHLYYEDQLPEITRHLQNLTAAGIDYDLYVTSSNYKNIIKLYSNGSTKFFPTENRGYDIGPFIYALHHLDLEHYDYVLKLHTKGKTSPNDILLNNRRLNNALWGKILWNALLGSAEQIHHNLAMMEQNPHIGMLAARYCLTDESKFYQKFLPQINSELQKMGLSPVNQLTFPAGSMFLARAKVLKPFLKYEINDFAPTDGKIKEGTFAHIVERLFGAVTATQGYHLAPAPHKSYFINRLLISIKRFIYQKKHTNSDKTLIKICKLPIYTR